MSLEDDLRALGIVDDVPETERAIGTDPDDDVMLTDAGNAEVFAATHREGLRWVSDLGTWLRFDGTRWARTPSESMIPLAIKTARSFYARAAAPGLDSKVAQDLARHARTTESAGKLEAMLRLARGLCVETAEAFDRDPFLLNVANGTIDLRTGLLRAHRREDMITMLSPVTYDPAATCPQWIAFLMRVLPDPPVRAWVQRYLGYCLTGDVGQQVLAFFFGRGANGKSTALEVLMYILGDYAKAGAPDLLLAKANEAHPTEQADLKGARMVVCQEVEAGRSWAERTIKQLTGGDTITARKMRCDFFAFKPTHKLVVAANHRPKVRGQDEAIWRRIRLVPFVVTIPKDERDPALPAKLRAEASGILAWCVAGCIAYQRDGLGDPPGVVDATAAYRDEQDHLGHFVEDACEQAPDAFAPTSVLFAAYATWCARSGDRPWTRASFREGLLEHASWQLADHRGAKGVRGIKGLRIKPITTVVQP